MGSPQHFTVLLPGPKPLEAPLSIPGASPAVLRGLREVIDLVRDVSINVRTRRVVGKARDTVDRPIAMGLLNPGAIELHKKSPQVLVIMDMIDLLASSDLPPDQERKLKMKITSDKKGLSAAQLAALVSLEIERLENEL